MKELQYWTEQIRRRRISRREFLGRAAVLGLSGAAALKLLTRAGIAAEGKKGGSARFGLAHGSTTDTLDPSEYPDSFTQTAFWGTLSNGLTEVDHLGNISGDAAESMESSDGTRKWVFKLRKGLTFHNGRTVTSGDVVASFRHHMGADSKSAIKDLLEPISDITADGPQTIVFTLKSGSADFPYLVSDYHLPIMPALEGGGADWRSGIRTGPFSLERFEPGVAAKFKRNPNYHKEGRPYLDEVEFLTLADPAARQSALITGDVHYIARADLKTLELLKRTPEIEVDEVTGNGHYVLPMHCDVPPFDNVDVRLALKYAIDRDEIVKKIFLDHATAGNDNPIPPPPAVKYAVDPKPRFAYDPDKAKHHLGKVGLAGLKVDISVSDAAFAGAVDTAILYKEQAAKAGIDINVIREASDGYWDNVWLKKPWCASYWGGRPTCDWMFTTAYDADAPWNESHWKNPRFNELLAAARGETDEPKRAAMYAEMQQLVHDDGGTIVLVFNNIVSAHSKALAHNEVAANWENDGMKIAERWWFA
ncbi:ABC transporter substrate-binding protein [Taklimakanibacter lacteus]|uniref:ABC transporter substrate-binding protein n=1 Tax=Taklimakanibacter lacteus TaxID=2268456 RepID=UPI000E669597